MKKLRVMIYNTGYFTGITGSKKEYVTKGLRFMRPNMVARRAMTNNLVRYIRKINPDILFLGEIHDTPHLDPIKKLFQKNYIDVKYRPGGLLRKLPFFRRNSNGVFLKKNLSVQTFFLQNGSKRLIYQVDIKRDTSIFFGHFALSQKTRKKQFHELTGHMKTKKQVVVAGDFNIFHGSQELEELLAKTHTRVINNLVTKTFPSFYPQHALDLFLASPSIHVRDLAVLDHILLSDHLPVVSELVMS